MRLPASIFPFARLGLPRALTCALGLSGLAGLSCADVPVDDAADSRVIAPAGVIQGTVLYQGPHPCSKDGHVVGNLILLFFDKQNPPPPAGVASTAVNFGVVDGDVLFQNEPRTASSTPYCPKDHGHTETITASSAFSVSPFAAGTYIIEAFYDYTGDFLPTFKFRNLPEMGDVAGGDIDTTDALLHADAGVDYKPIFLPVTVGVPLGTTDAGDDASQGAGEDGGTLVLPASGYVANDVTVSVGQVEPLARPYFYPAGATGPAPKKTPTAANPSGDANYVAAQTMAQDIQILAQPPVDGITLADITAFQSSLVSMKFLAGLPTNEIEAAVDRTGPFDFQLEPKTAKTSLFTWTDGTSIPESPPGFPLSNLLPQIVFTKLVDDPDHTLDPQSITQQVAPAGPVVIILGLTLPPSDALLDLVNYGVTAPGPTAATDHITALVRPLAICLDPSHPEAGATLVAPFLESTSADPTVKGPQQLFNVENVEAALTPVFGKVNKTPIRGCLPPGRYAPNFVYPTGQAWTVPNETGSCGYEEGTLSAKQGSKTGFVCPGEGTTAPRDALYSQGTRAVLEVTETKDSATCKAYPVPKVCQAFTP